MITNASVQQSTEQTMVTTDERATLLHRLYEMCFLVYNIDFIFIYRRSKWPNKLSEHIENLAYEKSHGIKVDEKLNNKNIDLSFYCFLAAIYEVASVLYSTN